MPRGGVSLTLEKKQLENRYGDGKGLSRFPVQKSDEYPSPPELKGTIKVTLPGDTLSRLVERTSYAVSEEATRASLNGVFVHGNASQLSFVATDGHRLARATCKGAFDDLTR